MKTAIAVPKQRYNMARFYVRSCGGSWARAYEMALLNDEDGEVIRFLGVARDVWQDRGFKPSTRIASLKLRRALRAATRAKFEGMVDQDGEQFAQFSGVKL